MQAVDELAQLVGSEGAFVHAQIPGSRLVTLDATGHCPQLSAPDETVATIAAFAGSVG